MTAPAPDRRFVRVVRCGRAVVIRCGAAREPTQHLTRYTAEDVARAWAAEYQGMEKARKSMSR